MLFNSPVFLFIFLPVVLLFLLLKKVSVQNIFLVIFSLVFYAWGGVSYTLILLGSVVVNYLSGLLIHKANNKWKYAALSLAVIINLVLLGCFKYANFVVDNLNYFLNYHDLKLFENKEIKLPIGISFYTFHAISYIVDVYRKKVEAQKNILKLTLYFTFFPQLIAGPIVRYHSISGQLSNRTITFDKIYDGIIRFIFGLGKKVIIANTFALIADDMFKLPLGEIDFYNAWLGVFSYTIQIYFDFSGYSDMAIGLALIFGFEFPENFNLPYISKSIKEFWQRWHISLSSWFKDYLYIPLGGNKLGNFRTYRNLLIVFICTGLWHGASFNFLIWGLFHGLFIVIEKLFAQKSKRNYLKPLAHLYTLLIVMTAWVFFRAETLLQAKTFIVSMFGFGDNKGNIVRVLFYFNIQVFIVGIIAIVLMFGWHQKLKQLIEKLFSYTNSISNMNFIIKNILTLIVLSLSILFIAAGTYNSFIYFRF